MRIMPSLHQASTDSLIDKLANSDWRIMRAENLIGGLWGPRIWLEDYEAKNLIGGLWGSRIWLEDYEGRESDWRIRRAENLIGGLWGSRIWLEDYESQESGWWLVVQLSWWQLKPGPLGLTLSKCQFFFLFLPQAHDNKILLLRIIITCLLLFCLFRLRSFLIDMSDLVSARLPVRK